MRSLHAPAPSSTLLKFLKSQSESICFFSPNPRPGFSFDHAAPRARALPLRTCSSVKSPSSARRLSTSSPRRATVEASFLNLDFLWPRSAAALKAPFRDPNETPRNRSLAYGGSLVAQRNAQSGSKKWHQKLWGATSLRGGRPLRPDDLPATLHSSEEDSDNSMFSLGRHISAKAAAQPKLRCTEFDENGNVVLASGEFKKSELIAKVRFVYNLTHHARPIANTGSNLVWTPPSRSQKDRQQSPPPYPRPTLRHPNKSPPPPRPNQSQPCARLRRVWYNGLL